MSKINYKIADKKFESDICTRKFNSSFTGKLLKNGIEIDNFSCIEEFTDVRFKTITNNLCETYSFIFDFDKDRKEYKMDKMGRWNFEFPVHKNPLLSMNIGIRSFQLDGIFKYCEYY